MNFSNSLELTQSQKLIITTQLKQSLNILHMSKLELENEINDLSEIEAYLEKSLKESYEVTTGRTSLGIHNSTRSEDRYNSMIHINPRLRKQYLSKDFFKFVNKSNKLDIIMTANLYKLNNEIIKN